jgi:hypothetical protein
MSSGPTQPVTDRFRFKTAEELQLKAEELGLALPFRADIGVLLQPIAVSGRVVPNRIVAQPMEGCDGGLTGAPGDLTRRRYLRIARGGSGVIWFEATSALAEARANPRQLWLTRDTLPAFRDLVHEARGAARDRFGPAHRPYLVVQLTHSGRFSRTAPPGQRKVACANPFLDRGPMPVWTDADLERVRDALVAAARLAASAGFGGYQGLPRVPASRVAGRPQPDSQPLRRVVRESLTFARRNRRRGPRRRSKPRGGCPHERDRRCAVSVRLWRSRRCPRLDRSRGTAAACAPARRCRLHVDQCHSRHPDIQSARRTTFRSSRRRQHGSARAPVGRGRPIAGHGARRATRSRGGPRRCHRPVVVAAVLAERGGGGDLERHGWVRRSRAGYVRLPGCAGGLDGERHASPDQVLYRVFTLHGIDALRQHRRVRGT